MESQSTRNVGHLKAKTKLKKEAKKENHKLYHSKILPGKTNEPNRSVDPHKIFSYNKFEILENEGDDEDENSNIVY